MFNLFDPYIRFRDRHLRNLLRLRIEREKHRKEILAFEEDIKKISNIYFDNWICREPTRREQIISNLKNLVRDAQGMVSKEKFGWTMQIMEKQKKLEEKQKEIERLKEIISCTSSRVIEIIEREKVE